MTTEIVLLILLLAVILAPVLTPALLVFGWMIASCIMFVLTAVFVVVGYIAIGLIYCFTKVREWAR